MARKSKRASYALAIDVGGTKLSGCIVDSNGKTLKSLRVPVEAGEGRERVLMNIERVVSGLKSSSEHELKGLGVSMAGFVDKAGKVLYAGGTLTCLVGVNLREELEASFNLPVFIENDANCFALAEAMFGAGKGYSVVLGVIWGTGIGGGIVVDGKAFRGAIGGAGEFGHMVLEPVSSKSHKCGCGQTGCLEMMASGKNVERLYREKGGYPPLSATDMWHSKEPLARATIRDAVHYLGLGLANLVNVLNPEVIVLGGGVSKLPDEAYDELREQVRKYALPTLTRDLKIARHEVSDDAGVLGAASLVFRQKF